MDFLKLPNIDFLDYLKFIGEQESQELRPAHEFRDSVIDFAKNGMQVSGPELPWSKINNVIRLKPGQLSIWAGRSGSGKSSLLGQVIAWRVAEQKAVIASLEMKPHQTLYKMCCQVAGCHPASIFVNGWLDYLEGRLWIYDQLDSIKSDRILGMAHYVFNEMDIDHLIIDSLTKCGFTRDDYSSQAKFVDKLQWICKRYNKHIHLVCHMRKSPGGKTSNTKDDIRGAGEISDLADNVFILERNHEKEDAVIKMENGSNLSPGENDKLTQPDCFFKVNKNRDYGIEPNFGLWLHKESNQFIPSDCGRPLPEPYRIFDQEPVS